MLRQLTHITGQEAIQKVFIREDTNVFSKNTGGNTRAELQL